MYTNEKENTCDEGRGQYPLPKLSANYGHYCATACTIKRFFLYSYIKISLKKQAVKSSEIWMEREN
jgi:hypothetical protein